VRSQIHQLRQWPQHEQHNEHEGRQHIEQPLVFSQDGRHGVPCSEATNVAAAGFAAATSPGRTLLCGDPAHRLARCLDGAVDVTIEHRRLEHGQPGRLVGVHHVVELERIGRLAGLPTALAVVM